MPERHSPESLQDIEWSELMTEALDMPGEFSGIYTRFYDYSINNQILLYLQGVEEPVATYKRWQAMNRQVKRGSKAKMILRPIQVKPRSDEEEDEQKRITKFKLVKCLFTASETEGEPLPEVEPAEWSETRALGALAITRVAFTQLNGNIQGYSFDRNVAVSPVAAYPMKTLIHEVAHIQHGHTNPEPDVEIHRGTAEFQAESTAYLALNSLKLIDQMNRSESRAYIRTWLRGEKPSDQSIRQVFKVTDEILKAGRAPSEATTFPQE